MLLIQEICMHAYYYSGSYKIQRECMLLVWFKVHTCGGVLTLCKRVLVLCELHVH